MGRKERAVGFSSRARLSHSADAGKQAKERRGRGFESLSPVQQTNHGFKSCTSAPTPHPHPKRCRIMGRLLIFSIFAKAPGPEVMRMQRDVSFQLG